MTKEELRTKYKQLRKTLSPRELEGLSQMIIDRLLGHFPLEHKNVSVFVPLTRFNEINTWRVLDAVNAEFSLPVIGEDDHLKHIRYEGKQQLRQNSFGILEPYYGAETEESSFDIVLVPLLTIDEKGYRVGYGKGYYDKFLARCRPDCLFIGLYQFETFEQIDNLYPSDVALHHCVTPSRVISFNR